MMQDDLSVVTGEQAVIRPGKDLYFPLPKPPQGLTPPAATGLLPPL